MRYKKYLTAAFLFLTAAFFAFPGQFEVQRLDEAGWENLLTRMKGKVLFVNVWATWCKPCREEFPDLIKLAAVYMDSNVEFISISADYPDEVDSKIVPFLEKVKANFPVYVQDFKNDQEFINMLSPKWNGALPATFIFDDRGDSYSFILGKRDFAFFKEEIEEVRSINSKALNY